MIFFFLREAFCGLEYAENAFVAHLQTLPHSVPSTSRLSRLRRSGLPPPVHIISGYPTVSVAQGTGTFILSTR